jgi:hypothetical protein
MEGTAHLLLSVLFIILITKIKPCQQVQTRYMPNVPSLCTPDVLCMLIKSLSWFDDVQMTLQATCLGAEHDACCTISPLPSTQQHCIGPAPPVQNMSASRTYFSSTDYRSRSIWSSHSTCINEYNLDLIRHLCRHGAPRHVLHAATDCCSLDSKLSVCMYTAVSHTVVAGLSTIKGQGHNWHQHHDHALQGIWQPRELAVLQMVRGMWILNNNCSCYRALAVLCYCCHYGRLIDAKGTAGSSNVCHHIM